MAKAALILGYGVLKARPALRLLDPAAVVGFGGYPTVPPLIAAARLRVPVVLHEQNAVMGRANRLLARFASLIATGFPQVRGIPRRAKAATLHTGNPVRPAVLSAAAAPYATVEARGPLRLLVFGGSQGAFWVMLALAAVCVLVSVAILNAPLGYYLRTIRDNEKAAQAIGVDIMRYKIIAMVISAVLASVPSATVPLSDESSSSLPHAAATSDNAKTAAKALRVLVDFMVCSPCGWCVALVRSSKS